jgi:hypothetical protein
VVAEPEVDPRKVRLGLLIVSVVVLVAIVLFFIVASPLGKAIMFAVTVLGVVRVARLVRQLRRQEP